MVSSLLDSLDGTTAPFFDYTFEQLLIMRKFEKISTKTFQTIISLHLDQKFYDNSISREINLRTKDLSSILKSTKKLKYLRNLFLSDTEFSFESIKTQKTLLMIVHQLMNATIYLDEEYQGTVLRILCVRHPIYLFNHWLSNVEIFSKNPRDFTVTIENDGKPWFLYKSMKRFSQLSPVERAVECIYQLVLLQEEYLTECKNLVTIDFERFVLNPELYASKIEQYCGRNFLNLSSRLNKENLPRKHINESINLPIYKKYASDKLSVDYDHKNDYVRLEKSIKQMLSQEHFSKIATASRIYESRFGVWFDK